MNAPAEFRTVHAACPHDCPDTCSLRVSVAGGRAVRVAGNPDHPNTQGVLCTKVSRYVERTYHPESTRRTLSKRKLLTRTRQAPTPKITHENSPTPRP